MQTYLEFVKIAFCAAMQNNKHIDNLKACKNIKLKYPTGYNNN